MKPQLVLANLLSFYQVREETFQSSSVLSDELGTLGNVLMIITSHLAELQEILSVQSQKLKSKDAQTW